jgi:hypothetical protein
MVDYIRSAYTVDVRFFHDSPATTRQIQWSFVAEEKPGMPWAHAFGSRTWDIGEEPEPLVGEVDGPRNWRGGTPPYALPIVGPLRIDNLGLCGTEEQWQNGASIMDPIPANWLNTPIPRCCKRPPLFARGGVAVGSSPPVHAPCCGEFGLPVAVMCKFTNTVPVCAVLEGISFPILQSSEQPLNLFGAVSYFRSQQFISGGKDWRFWLACSEFSNFWALFAISFEGEYLGDITFDDFTCAPFAMSKSFIWPPNNLACGMLSGDVEILG